MSEQKDCNGISENGAVEESGNESQSTKCSDICDVSMASEASDKQTQEVTERDRSQVTQSTTGDSCLSDANAAPDEVSTNTNDADSVSMVEPPEESSEMCVTPSEETVPLDSSISKSSEIINFKVIFNKKKYEVELPSSHTIKQLKEHLHKIIDVVPAMQKIMIKGLANDHKTLGELGVTKVSKVLVIGSKFQEVMKINDEPKPSSSKTVEKKSVQSTEKDFNQLEFSKKVLAKGKPDDVMAGAQYARSPLPSIPITGMLNKGGNKVRLTFKLELDQIWISTKARTDKISMSGIKVVLSQPIKGHEEYHIMAIQLGSTSLSRYFFYWVPAQYVDAIKSTILGA